MRQVGAVTGNVLSSAGSAAWSWQRPLCTASSRAANVSTHRGLSPQSHTEVTLSHSTRGILDASGFHACKECPGSVPSSRVCMDGWMDGYFGSPLVSDFHQCAFQEHTASQSLL